MLLAAPQPSDKGQSDKKGDEGEPGLTRGRGAWRERNELRVIYQGCDTELEVAPWQRQQMQWLMDLNVQDAEA